jgi:SlyX protein
VVRDRSWGHDGLFMVAQPPKPAVALEELHARINELEMKSAYQEDLLSTLDGVVREFAARTETAERKLRELEAQVKQAESGGTEVGPQSDKPPHY